MKNILGIMKGVRDEVDEGSEEEEGDESDEADDITGLFLQTRYGRNTTSWKRVNYRYIVGTPLFLRGGLTKNQKF